MCAGRDVRAAVDLCHRDGSLKRAVAKDPGHYIHEARNSGVGKETSVVCTVSLYLTNTAVFKLFISSLRCIEFLRLETYDLLLEQPKTQDWLIWCGKIQTW